MLEEEEEDVSKDLLEWKNIKSCLRWFILIFVIASHRGRLTLHFLTLNNRTCFTGEKRYD
jgi:hypothetical protein